jgi:hypothetical protein
MTCSGASCAGPTDAVVRSDAQRVLDSAFSSILQANVESVRPREGDDHHAEMRVGFTLTAKEARIIQQGCYSGRMIEPNVPQTGGELGLLYRKVKGEWRVVAHQFLCPE